MLDMVGAVIFVCGFGLEIIADLQKYVASYENCGGLAYSCCARGVQQVPIQCRIRFGG